MKNEPALNLTPSTSNGSSAANIFAFFRRKRSEASAGSAVAFKHESGGAVAIDAA